MLGPFVHNIDPIILSLGSVHLWWYGLSFTLGFINAHVFIKRNRNRLGFSVADSYTISLLLAIGILIGGRSVVVFNNEWDFYRNHLELIPAIWTGGFASHGLILGGAIAVILFCYVYKKRVRPVLDVLAISSAFILGCGRIGNFIDGQIFGTITDLPWGVEFPVIEGFRHPVVLYDGLKNFALIPLLLWIRKRGVPPGRVAIIFVITYALFRIPIDTLREYPSQLLGLGNGQTLNLIMLVIGVIALTINVIRNRRRLDKDVGAADQKTYDRPASTFKKLAFAAICVLPLLIPSDATRDIPASYGSRHAGLEHSWMYPSISAELDAAERARKSREQGQTVSWFD